MNYYVAQLRADDFVDGGSQKMALEFMDAVRHGDRATVERMLARDPALADARDADGTPALLVAQYRDHTDVADLIARHRHSFTIFEVAALGDLARVQALVEGDASLANATAPDGFSPLGLASFFHHADVARFLLEQGADPNVPSQNEMRVVPLHSALAGQGDPSIARMLIEAGADVNIRQRHGWTPLHEAALVGHADLVDLLLDHGADASARNDDGMTPIDLARNKRWTEIERRLSAGAPAR